LANELLNALGIQAAFVRLGNDNGEPDVVYERDGHTLGIEIATAYYDNSDAKQEWTLARGERTMPPEGYEAREAVAKCRANLWTNAPSSTLGLMRLGCASK
jgi:hypothetical protein